MALDLARFLGGSLVLLIPGICLAQTLRWGDTWLQRAISGSAIGLALAVYLASAVSHLDLRGFWPLWAIVGLLAIYAVWTAPAPSPGSPSSPVPKLSADGPLLLILLLVGVTRFAPALYQTLPIGWDPTFHLILAKKIQLTHHAISDWTPFASIPLNYPTGSHVLIVILANLTGLPLHTVFKDLIPLLGVLTTAQIFVLARRMTSDDAAALYSALIYGLWAWFGSINYYDWGGLPNELAMFFLIAFLAAWFDVSPRRFQLAIMALLFAALVLAHHHVMVVSVMLLGALALYVLVRRPPMAVRCTTLLLSLLIAAVLDAFFLVPFAFRLATLHSTHVWHDAERPVSFTLIPSDCGYAVCAMVAIGFLCWATRRRISFPPAAIIASAVLLAGFFATEYVWPLLLQASGRPPSNAFTPTRFITDLNYFLPILAGVTAAFLRKSLRLAPGLMLAALLLISLTEIPDWQGIYSPDSPSPGLIAACRWIGRSTPPSTIVYNADPWIPYLSWRRTIHVPIPISEPLDDLYAEFHHADDISAGRAPPDQPDQEIVAIVMLPAPASVPILWSDDVSHYAVVLCWPKRTP